MANELIVIEQATALNLFTTPDKINQLIEQIKQKAETERNELDTDLSVAKNRKAVASLAYKVTQTKTYIDKAGKEVVDELKVLPKKVDAARKLFRDELDALSDEIRRPVTEWEEVEKSRIEAEELAKQVERDHEEALQMNELFDLRKAEEERKRKEHEEELKRQAAEQARIEAEQKARREIEEAARKEAEARQAAERAEREKQEAIERAQREAKEAQECAERDKQAAVEAERRKSEEAEKARLAEIERQKQEEANRQADTLHRSAVNNQAMQDLITAGIPEECAKACVIAIAKGSVTNIKITY
ncbi:cell envelope biogenesis protein TolA [Xenorhabdus bovienii]|uniref:cell envelope biogenesis protein TolA n=1 Tax=Xenorhabdus bovienii TaxID=40576 RepID=UPI00237C6CEA|nr:cell envelope biogenesis protein TolA [Xenorhabdus bovienii]MDE1488907.1 cell envelope biogenesis protein TolA [Xenorhabdus bovienii]MDE9479867.1 cell envelope biogenesis protein TolA [Xenorhabdus bovienii]MDE9532912.1 cell envelope biogenesis protein TolA [Xenorhabdus bovienii]